MIPKATNITVAMDTKTKATEADTISGAEEIRVASINVVPARVDPVMIREITAQRWTAISVQIRIATEEDEYQITPTVNATSNVGDEKALGVTTIVIREARASIKISSTIAKDKAVEADTIVTMEAATVVTMEADTIVTMEANSIVMMKANTTVTMEVIIITGSSITIKISSWDSRTMAMVAKIVSSLTSLEL